MLKVLKILLFALWFYPLFVTMTLIAGFVCLISSLFSKKFARVISGQVWASVVLGPALTNLIVTGQDNIPQCEGGYIVYCNHRSMLDIPVTAMAIERPLTWVAKSTLGRIPVFGWVLKRVHLLVERQGGPEAAKKMIAEASERLKGGEIITIFPEGTRNTYEDPPLLPFKKGAFILAKHTKVPLLPVAIYNSGALWPAGVYLPKVGTIKVTIGKPLTISEGESLSLITSKAFESLDELYRNLAMDSGKGNTKGDGEVKGAETGTNNPG
ncbi:MAG: 1-acyl-sn-glycerol-3-phosphate acyltransferase [Deltaproteobacteria bacterium]|jgi:1-acyl-sn-glycerol-3-phosphate acyltransferase|nr:1-acyl-sn-glycerol-3-phosphate acyltransferase [Deltaproteobacteria bacterium]